MLTELHEDFLERFGQVFSEMAPAMGQEVSNLEFPFFMEHLLDHLNILHLPHLLMLNENMSKPLISLML